MAARVNIFIIVRLLSGLAKRDVPRQAIQGYGYSEREHICAEVWGVRNTVYSFRCFATEDIDCIIVGDCKGNLDPLHGRCELVWHLQDFLGVAFGRGSECERTIMTGCFGLPMFSFLRTVIG